MNETNEKATDDPVVLVQQAQELRARGLHEAASLLENSAKQLPDLPVASQKQVATSIRQNSEAYRQRAIAKYNALWKAQNERTYAKPS
jgi:hypothetical protein